MELIFFSSRFWKKVFELQSAPFRVKAFSLESLLFYWAPWHLLVSLFTKSSNNYREGPSINYVVSVGGKGIKNCRFYTVKRRLRGGRGQKLSILRRHSLWTAPEEGAIAFPKVGSSSNKFSTSKLRKHRIFVDIIEGIKENFFDI